jgi:hypothetical protein
VDKKQPQRKVTDSGNIAPTMDKASSYSADPLPIQKPQKQGMVDNSTTVQRQPMTKWKILLQKRRTNLDASSNVFVSIKTNKGVLGFSSFPVRL